MDLRSCGKSDHTGKKKTENSVNTKCMHLDCHSRGTRCAAECTPSHVGHGVCRLWGSLTEGRWKAISRVARSTSASWLRRIAVHVRVQPVHGHGNVIPHGDNQNHATIQGLSHGFHATLFSKGIAVTERSLLSCAESVRLDVVIATDCVIWVVDLLAILHVELLNASQLACCSMEPSDNLERHLGVDLELSTWAVEVPLTHAECIDVAAITIGNRFETVTILGTALLILHAHVETLDGGWVWCECCGNLVGLPQVHLSTACTHVASSAVVIRICLVWDPSFAVALARHPLEVAGALSITVTGSVCGAGRVALTHVSSLLHLREVNGGVGSAWHV